MVTIATYYRLEAAQQEADIIANKGFAVEIEQSDLTGAIGGGQPSFYLKVKEEALDAIDTLREEILEEAAKNNPYSCPNCGSKNYAPYEPPLSMLATLARMWRKPFAAENELPFRCNSCQTTFKITLTD